MLWKHMHPVVLHGSGCECYLQLRRHHVTAPCGSPNQLQEPPLADGPTVDDNIQPGVQRIRDMVADFEKVGSVRRNTTAHAPAAPLPAPVQCSVHV